MKQYNNVPIQTAPVCRQKGFPKWQTDSSLWSSVGIERTFTFSWPYFCSFCLPPHICVGGRGRGKVRTGWLDGGVSIFYSFPAKLTHSIFWSTLIISSRKADSGKERYFHFPGVATWSVLIWKGFGVARSWAWFPNYEFQREFCAISLILNPIFCKEDASTHRCRQLPSQSWKSRSLECYVPWP